MLTEASPELDVCGGLKEVKQSHVLASQTLTDASLDALTICSKTLIKVSQLGPVIASQVNINLYAKQGWSGETWLSALQELAKYIAMMGE